VGNAFERVTRDVQLCCRRACVDGLRVNIKALRVVNFIRVISDEDERWDVIVGAPDAAQAYVLRLKSADIAMALRQLSDVYAQHLNAVVVQEGMCIKQMPSIKPRAKPTPSISQEALDECLKILSRGNVNPYGVGGKLKQILLSLKIKDGHD